MPKNTILRIILLSCMYATQLVYGQSSCSSSPCPSLHLCVPLADTSYRCICIDPSCFQRVETTTPTIQGEPNTKAVDHCASSPCSIGFRCVSYTSTYNCICLSESCKNTNSNPLVLATTTTTTSTTNQSESFLIDICSPNPCLNSGQCVQTAPTRAICKCLPGFTGFICEQPDPCYSSPCMNDATCYPIFGALTTYRCSCPEGFQGANCEINSRKMCTLQTCYNGGLCNIDQVTQRPYCTCSIFFTGSRCETRFNPCFTLDGHPVCENEGKCSINYGVYPYYQCQCSSSHSGTRCENELTTTTKMAVATRSDDNTCKDMSPICEYYAANSFCSNYYFLNGTPIPQYCPKSCKRCELEPATTSRPCYDTQFTCQFWGSSGNCKRLPDPTICRKSCGLCG